MKLGSFDYEDEDGVWWVCVPRNQELTIENGKPVLRVVFDKERKS